MNGTGHPDATIVVFETKPRWAPELQHQFVEENVRVVTVGRVRDISAEVESGGAVVVLLDFDTDPPGCLTHLGRSSAERIVEGGFSRTIVILTEVTSDLEWPIREAGVTSVLDEFVPGHALADACRRAFRGRPTHTN